MSGINMASPVNWTHPLNRGLVSWWMVLPGMTSGARFTDITNSNGNHGTLTNMDHLDWVGSKDGWGALDLDGSDDYINVPWPHALNDDSITILATVNTDSASTRQVIASRDDAAGSRQFYFQFDASGNLQLGVYIGNGTSFDATIGTVVANKDTFVACRVIDAVSKTVWLDQKTNVSTGGAVEIQDQATTDDLQLGRRSRSGSEQEFNGRIMSIAFYRRDLRDSEVELYRALSKQGYPGLLNRIEPRRLVAAAPGLDPDLIMAAIRPASQPVLVPTGVVPY